MAIRRLSVLTSCLALSACSTSAGVPASNVSLPPPTTTTGAARTAGFHGAFVAVQYRFATMPLVRQKGFLLEPRAVNKPLLFVSDFQNSDVLIFTLGHAPPLVATITDGVAYPQQIPFDRKRTLYVTNVFAKYRDGIPHRTTAPSKTLTSGLNAPNGIVIDSAGKVYVSNNGSAPDIVEYKRGHSVPSKTITGIQYPLGLALDASENLYVGAEYAGVYEVPKGSTTPQNLGLQQTGFVIGVAFDSAGDMFVANCNPQNNITVYHPGQTTPYQTINYNGECPYYISIGNKQDLYVPYIFNSNVAIYKPGATTPFEDITQNMNQPASAVTTRWPKP